MKSPPLKWHGGKSYLAKRIIALMPPHLHYVEPYFGGGVVLLARDPERNWYKGAPDYDGSAKMRGCSEVVNDINGELMNFWDVLRNGLAFRMFCQDTEAIPFSESHWQKLAIPESNAPLDRAIAFFVRCRQSRAGKFNEFATLSRNRTRRGMNEQASAWLSCVEGLPAVHARLKRVVILCQDALNVIRQQDGPNTLFYCDPPYLHSTRASTGDYAHEMSEREHGQLVNVLAGISGAFQLSGYHSELYDDYAADFGWHCREFNLPNNAAGGKSKRRMTECVWTNYEPK